VAKKGSNPPPPGIGCRPAPPPNPPSPETQQAIAVVAETIFSQFFKANIDTLLLVNWSLLDLDDEDTWPDDDQNVLVYCQDQQWPERMFFQKPFKRFAEPIFDGWIRMDEVTAWRPMIDGIDRPTDEILEAIS
jgi:hypothetical protein